MKSSSLSSNSGALLDLLDFLVLIAVMTLTVRTTVSKLFSGGADRFPKDLNKVGGIGLRLS